MKRSLFFVLLFCLLGLALAKRKATDSVAKRGVGNNVCKGANMNPMPGGWKLLTKKQAQANQFLQTTIDQTIEKNSDCVVRKINIQKACVQVTNGINYKWSAKIMRRCGKKNSNVNYNGSFTIVNV